MSVEEGLTVPTPSGDVYRLHWEPLREVMVITLVQAGDREKCSMAITVRPRAGNSIEVKPLRRDD